jgi:hypothetical protein
MKKFRVVEVSSSDFREKPMWFQVDFNSGFDDEDDFKVEYWESFRVRVRFRSLVRSNWSQIAPEERFENITPPVLGLTQKATVKEGLKINSLLFSL